jgi:hypothetical protein
LLFLLLLVVSSSGIDAQQVILNTRGERIVVYPDGSWRYYERADSTLMNKNLLKGDVLLADDKKVEAGKDATSNPKTDIDMSSLAQRFAERVAVDLQAAQKRLTRILEEKFEAEARLTQAEENKELLEPDILARLEEEYAMLTNEVKTARAHQKWLERIFAQTQEMLAMPIEQKPKVLNKLIRKYDAYFAPETEEFPIVSTPAPSPAPRVKPEETDVISVDVPHTAVYTRAPVPCILASGSTGANSIAVEKQLLFTHTDEELRPYFRQQELVTCYAALTQIENNLYLTLDFHIASPDARKNFGMLESNSMLRLKLIDGTFINLFNAHSDQGRIDAYTGNTVYSGNYLLDKETEKELSRNELDKVRIVWSTGFEDYDIVNLDFLINQFSCLRSHTRNE